VVNDHQPDHLTSNGAAMESTVEQKITFEQKLLKARQLVKEDPKSVAQLVRSWMREND
jgi:flagellar biosynthesis/type III secretory pathway M-ring protein FliF/YscJ